MNIFAATLWALWVVSWPIPERGLDTHERYRTEQQCNDRIRYLEKKYYLDKQNHARSRSGTTYYMVCFEGKLMP